MKTVAGLVMLLCAVMVRGLSIDVSIGTSSDFSAGPCNLQTSSTSEASETFDKTACESFVFFQSCIRLVELVELDEFN